MNPDFRGSISEQDYDNIISHRLSKISDTMLSKSKEYTRLGDKLHNFNKGSAIVSESRERYLMSLATKHITSAMDMIDDIDVGVQHPDGYIEEKIGDIINYMILLEVCLKHRNMQYKSYVNAKNIM